MKETDRTLHEIRKLAVCFVFSCEEILRNQNYLINFGNEVMGKIQDNPYNTKLFFALSDMDKKLRRQRSEIDETLACCRRVSDTVEAMNENRSSIDTLKEHLQTLCKTMKKSGENINGDFECMEFLQWESGELYKEQCLLYRQQCAETVNALQDKAKALSV